MEAKKHGHKHHGKSTRDILDPKRILLAIKLENGQKFLDAGCGDGFISIEASKIVGNQGQVYALDEYEPSLDHIRSEIQELEIKNIQVIQSDMTKSIPLDNNRIDRCVMANVLHGFAAEDTLKPVLKEIMRVLKPGGTFAVVEFDKVEGPPGPPYNIRLSPEDIEKILEDHEFRIIGTEDIGKYHYLVESYKD